VTGIDLCGDAMKWLRRINLAFAVYAILAPAAHVLELPNKLALTGALWLAVQQHLYRGWGPIIGAPAEIGSLLTSLMMLALRRRDHRTRGLTLLAALAYVGMLTAFFVLNAPVNAAVSRWTASTLSPDWKMYRLWWESGHTIAFVLATIALVALVRGALVETRPASIPGGAEDKRGC
jgi:hypothetical protein